MPDNNLLNAFFTMGAIVLILLTILIVLKRIARKKQSGGSTYDMKVVSRMPLQQKAQLAIVEVQGKKLLIGLTEQNVNLLADLSQDTTNGTKIVGYLNFLYLASFIFLGYDLPGR
jgi:flagellar protein FliO/FliZ